MKPKYFGLKRSISCLADTKHEFSFLDIQKNVSLKKSISTTKSHLVEVPSLSLNPRCS